MSNQTLPTRPWLLLGSIVRPTIPPTPAAAPLPPPAAPAPASAPPSPTVPLIRPSLPLPTLLRPVAAVSLPRPPPLLRALSTDLTATIAPQPQEHTPLPTASASLPAPIIAIPSTPPASSKVTPATATTGPPVPSSAIQKPVAPKPVPSPSLSYLTLPPPQIKALDEEVPAQIPLQAGQKNAKATMDGAAGIVKEKPEAGHKGSEVIMIMGKNMGATMELTRATRNSNKGKHGAEERGHKGKAAAMAVYMNSNVQGINNSIHYKSSCSHRDHGVHFLGLNSKPDEGGSPYIEVHKP